MFSKSKSEQNKIAVVHQDPRTSVKTTSAKTESTNTTFQYSSTFDTNKNKVTYQTTKRTITHFQEAHETEIVLRRTPTKEELEEMMKMTNIGKPEDSTTAKKKNSNNPFSFANVFDKDESPKSPTIMKTQKTSVTQNVGRIVTANVEHQQIKFGPKNFKISSPNSPLSKKSLHKIDARPYSETPTLLLTSTQPYVGYERSSTSTNYSSPYLRPSPLKNQLTLSNYNPFVPVTKNISSTLTTTGKRLKPAVAFILNHEIFDSSNNEFRVGSSEDVKSLTKVFKSYNVKVTLLQDANLNKINSTIKKIEKSDFSAHSAIIVVILSHGSQRDIISAKDNSYNIDETILHPILNNSTLHDKPKLFFIQACKGSIEVEEVHTDAVKMCASPNEIYKCYSTFEGYVAYRTNKGSFFIQTLCETIDNCGKTEDIKSIMEKVTRIVKEKTKNKQIPTVTSTLTKEYIFGHYI